MDKDFDWNPSKEELDFLYESNAIEDVWDKRSLDQALVAWRTLLGEDRLTEENILLAHAFLMVHQDIEKKHKGAFRDCDVRVAGRICPEWQTIPFAFGVWLESANKHMPVTADAAKALHISFEHLHPFVDGNGRIGRMLLNWHRVKSGLEILIIKEAEKFVYYKWFELPPTLAEFNRVQDLIDNADSKSEIKRLKSLRGDDFDA